MQNTAVCSFLPLLVQETAELRERLAESERLVAQMNKSWEERLKETDTLNKVSGNKQYIEDERAITN